MHRYWLSTTRYYSAEITKDLFGTWLLIRRWGGRYNARSQSKTIVVESYDRGIQLIDDIAKKRMKRGYEET